MRERRDNMVNGKLAAYCLCRQEKYILITPKIIFQEQEQNYEAEWNGIRMIRMVTRWSDRTAGKTGQRWHGGSGRCEIAYGHHISSFLASFVGFLHTHRQRNEWQNGIDNIIIWSEAKIFYFWFGNESTRSVRFIAHSYFCLHEGLKGHLSAL